MGATVTSPAPSSVPPPDVRWLAVRRLVDDVPLACSRRLVSGGIGAAIEGAAVVDELPCSGATGADGAPTVGCSPQVSQ